MRTLDNRRAVLLAGVGHNTEPIAGTASVSQNIECFAHEARWRIAGWLAKLAVRAVTVEPSGSGEDDALFVLFDNVAAFDGSDVPTHPDAPVVDQPVFCTIRASGNRH